VLTAGLGTRLRPLTLARAKAAVPVDGEPLARRVIRWLVSHGVTDLVLNLHHRPASITALVGDGADLGARVRYSWESPVLGSAGGPRHALPLLLDRPGSDRGQTGVRPGSNRGQTGVKPGSDRGQTGVRPQGDGKSGANQREVRVRPGSDRGQTPVEPPSNPRLTPVEPPSTPGRTPRTLLLVNGDTMTDVNLTALRDRHRQTGALVTMALIPNPRPDKYGGVLLDERGRVTGFTRRGTPQPSFHFVGVQAVEPEVFESLPDGVPAESVGGVYPPLMAERPGSVIGFVSDAMFQDIGTPSDLLETSLDLASAAGRESRPLWGARVEVAPSARVTRSLLWDDVTVGADAELHECIVADGVTIPDRDRYERCAIVMTDSGMVVERI
jgi:NDP-sugar pyrophosphorylase family protein